MSRRVIVLTLSAVCAVCLTGPSLADQSKGVQGAFWVQGAFGRSMGDDQVSGQVDADIGVSGVPIIGSVGATIPLAVDVRFEDPSGILVGGELIFRRIGFEVNVLYLQEAATVQGGIRMCGGLLTQAECEILRQGVPLVPGIPVPDFLGVEEDLWNVAATVGANYHFFPHKRLDIWMGPMVVWSAWDYYDFSDIRVHISTSLENLLKGRVDHCKIDNLSEISPEDGLTYGVNAGGRCDLVGRWSLLGHFRYFAGDDFDLPGGSGSYSAVGITVGIARRFGT